MITRGPIYRHLGYPLGVDVANVQLIDRFGSKLKNEFKYWKSQLWPIMYNSKWCNVS